MSSQWPVPPEDGFGLGGGGTDRVDPGDDKPCPAGLLGVGGADFAANFSLRAFCMQSGQVTSLAFADWNHLPQTMQRIFTLLMRFLPCSMQNFQVHTLLLRRNALSILDLPIVFVYPLILRDFERAGAHFCLDAFNDDH